MGYIILSLAQDAFDTIGILSRVNKSYDLFGFVSDFAKLSSSWTIPLKSNLTWDYLYYHCQSHPPTHPGKYIWATSTLPRKLRFDIEALFNQTRSISQLASPHLVSRKCHG